jgi:hypothetical protein
MRFLLDELLIKWFRLVPLLAIAGVAIPSFGQVPGTKGGSIEEQAVDVKVQWLKAAQSHDISFLDKLFAPDFHEVSSAGDVLTKAQVFERARSTHRIIDEIRSDVIKVRVYGNAVVLTDRTTIRYHDDKGTPFTGELTFVRVLLRRNDNCYALIMCAMFPK